MNKFNVKLRKPFSFEGKEYTDVDLSGLEKLTGRDMEEIEKTLSRENLDTINAELTLHGTMLYAARQLNFSRHCLRLTAAASKIR